MDLTGDIRNLIQSELDLDACLDRAVRMIRAALGITRVTVMLYNRTDNMLESVAAVGVPNIDHRNIRAPVLRIDGISSRAVEARAFLENRPIVVRDRGADPQYRLRHRFPHKNFSREFAVFPLSVRKRKLGIIAISVDEDNRAGLNAARVRLMRAAAPLVARLLVEKMPAVPTDRKMAGVMTDIISRSLCRMVYQPIVDVPRRKIHGYEALLRVDHPLIKGPEDLIHHAERFNALRDVSFLAHSKALRVLRGLDAGVRLFLNLHPNDFVEYENLDHKSNPFYGKDLGRVVLELTERYCLKETDRVHSIIRFFKGLGARIALDDLGSGFSSLEMLTSLAPDYIKFDMSLIRNIHRNDRKQKLLRSLLFYGDQIGSLCVAEGVETKEEFDALVAMRCPLFQGFVLARPESELSDDGKIRARLKELL